MKFTQIAIYHPRLDVAKKENEDTFIREIYKDSMLMDGMFAGKKVEGIQLNLMFLHGLFEGSEIEFISSPSEFHWHKKKIELIGNVPFLSHIGAYLGSNDFAYYSSYFKSMFSVLQDSISHEHTRPNCEHKSYNDLIFDSENAIGFNIKLTRRLHDSP